MEVTRFMFKHSFLPQEFLPTITTQAYLQSALWSNLRAISSDYQGIDNAFLDHLSMMISMQYKN